MVVQKKTTSIIYQSINQTINQLLSGSFQNFLVVFFFRYLIACARENQTESPYTCRLGRFLKMQLLNLLLLLYLFILLKYTKYVNMKSCVD